jgi:hypothetical protein
VLDVVGDAVARVPGALYEAELDGAMEPLGRQGRRDAEACRDLARREWLGGFAQELDHGADAVADVARLPRVPFPGLGRRFRREHLAIKLCELVLDLDLLPMNFSGFLEERGEVRHASLCAPDLEQNEVLAKVLLWNLTCIIQAIEEDEKFKADFSRLVMRAA